MLKKEVFIASDHAGFESKENLKFYLMKKRFKVTDLGPEKYNKDDDYPDYAFTLAKQTVAKKIQGILICGSGAGMCISANKVKGARAVQIYDLYSARMSRFHNDANIACFRSKEFNQSEMKKLAMLFLETKFSNEKRHKRRIEKIKKYES